MLLVTEDRFLNFAKLVLLSTIFELSRLEGRLTAEQCSEELPSKLDATKSLPPVTERALFWCSMDGL